jgi:hypothetical protein
VLKNIFELTFTLEAAATANTTLYFKIFDPDNFIGLGNNDNNAASWLGDDNYATLTTTTGSITIAEGQTSVYLTVIAYPSGYTGTKETGNNTTIVIDAAHAGDNFIVVVDTEQAKTNGATLGTTETTRYTESHGYYQSELLTVWRTLNVELDVATWTGMPAGDLKAPLDGLVEEELARACIVTKEFLPNNTAAPTVNSQITQAQTDLICSDNVGSGRDISGNSAEFWTIRIVTVPAYGIPLHADALGAFTPNQNTIEICYDKIKDVVDNWNTNNDPDVDLMDNIRRTVLHEICHVLINGAEHYVVFDTSDVARDILGNEIDASTIGIRSNISNANGTDFGRRLQYSHVLTTDIRDIQSHSIARN